MVRSEYAKARLAEIGARPHGAPRKPALCPQPKRRPKRELPIPRVDTIARIGHAYVFSKRTTYADRPATWIDVAQAYADGWLDAESVRTAVNGSWLYVKAI